MEIPMPNPPKHFQWKMIVPTIINLLSHLLHSILHPIYTLINLRRPANVPPIKNTLLTTSASTLAKMIRNGEISSQTVVESYIERIKEVNPLLNAVIEDRFEEALNEAKICDQKLCSGEVTAAMLEQEKPLYGVPFTVKESCSVKGLSYTGGAIARKGVKSAEDGAAVETFRNAGAIPLCVTNTPELCGGFHTKNFIFGETKNPYDRRRSPGGSSGGEGALIGAGASILGIGSDLFGSIRVPSLFNGIYGHKPSPGIISIQGHFPTSHDPLTSKFMVVGPLARYMEDLQFAMKILTSKTDIYLGLDDPVDLKNLRVFFIDNFESFCGIRDTKSDVRLTIKKAARHLAQRGARVRQLSQDWVASVFNIITGLLVEMEFPSLLLNSKHPEKKKRAICEFLKAIFGVSDHILSVTLLEVGRELRALSPNSAIKHMATIREDLRLKLNDLLKDDGVLICPTHPGAAPMSQLSVLLYGYIVYTAIANVMYLPATHVPAGLNYRGLPIGFQVSVDSVNNAFAIRDVLFSDEGRKSSVLASLTGQRIVYIFRY